MEVVIKLKKNMTSEELFGKHFNGMHYDDITSEMIKKYAVEFAKIKVREAVELIKDNVDKRTIDNAFDIDELCQTI